MAAVSMDELSRSFALAEPALQTGVSEIIVRLSMPAASIFCNRCGFSSADDAQFCQRCGATLAVQPVVPVARSPLSSAPHYGGFWIRVIAGIIDMLLLVVALYPVRLLLGSAITLVGMDAQMPTHEMFQMRRLARFALGIALGWAYKAGIESSRHQATLGKMALRLKVTDVEGSRLTFGRATGRHFAKYLSALSLGIGYLMVAFDEQKQGLHDRIAGTLVRHR
jgi:uncharacterized RDD family membrane protein YckC